MSAYSKAIVQYDAGRNCGYQRDDRHYNIADYLSRLTDNRNPASTFPAGEAL